jgi:dehydrogenase/reductase SDR family protein 7B
MNINFFGAVRLTNLIVQQMVEEDDKNILSGSKRRNYAIVNVGSVQSYLAIPYRSAYTSSKHALLAYSDSLRGELYLHKNIDIINCQPGYINTNVSINALTSDGQTNSQNDDDHKKGYEPSYVSHRIMRAIINHEKEVLIAVLFHRMGIWLRFFAPSIYFWVMYLRGKSTFEKKYQ